MSDPYLTITVFRDERVLARTLAERIASSLAGQPRQVLGLATGRTPVRLYHELGALHARGRADFSHVTTFNLDEYYPMKPDSIHSYHRYMWENLFAHINIMPENVHIPRGNAPRADVERNCEEYEAAIRKEGGIDLQLLGIGTNGHIGFNEPGRELASRTHRVALKASTRRSNAALFGGDVDRVPKEALSMGMGSILRARRLVLIATGKSKAKCVERLVHGPITTKLPASFLQLHGAVEILLDEPAAQSIR